MIIDPHSSNKRIISLLWERGKANINLYNIKLNTTKIQPYYINLQYTGLHASSNGKVVNCSTFLKMPLSHDHLEGTLLGLWDDHFG